MARKFYPKFLSRKLPEGYKAVQVVSDFTSLEARVTVLEGAGGGSGLWSALKTASFTFVAEERFVIEATGAPATADLPASVNDAEEFVLHNSTASTQVVDLDPLAGHTIRGYCGDAVGGTDTIVLAPGDTIHLVAISSTVLEIV